MSKTNVLVYYDLNGGDDETVQTVKEKAAFLRGRVGGRSVNVRDANLFDEVEPRVAIAVLLGGTSSTALASVYQAYEAVGVPLSSYDEFVGGDGADLIEEDEEPESAGSYLGRLKAAATDRGLTFTDATTADELEAMIKSHDDAKHQKVIDDMAEFDELSKEAVELGVPFEISFTNEQLRADVEAAREKKREAEEALKALRTQAEELGVPTDDEMTSEQVEQLIAEKLAADKAAAEAREDEEAPAFDVETADFDALKAKADAMEIAYPSNIGEATLRKKIADHLAEETE